MPKLQTVSWLKVENWLSALAQTCASVDTLVGVSRGGSPIAVALSYLLPGRALLHTARARPTQIEHQKYDFDTPRLQRVQMLHDQLAVGKEIEDFRNILVLDDVATFGDTMKCVQEKISEKNPSATIRFACYGADLDRLSGSNPWLLECLHYELAIDNSKVWLAFPWRLQSHNTDS